MSEIEKRARELLAASYEQDGRDGMAESVRDGTRMLGLDDVAIRAIVAALTPPDSCALAAAARASLPFVAYAFAQGVDGAEEAGRAIEAALQTSVPEGYVLVPVQPTPGLLMSMAVRADHALGCPGYYDQQMFKIDGHVSHQRMLEVALAEARKQHEEVVGAGFYSPEKESGYAAMLAGRLEVSGG